MDGLAFPIARSTLPEAAAERLRALIIEGELAPLVGSGAPAGPLAAAVGCAAPPDQGAPCTLLLTCGGRSGLVIHASECLLCALQDGEGQPIPDKQAAAAAAGAVVRLAGSVRRAVPVTCEPA